MCDVQISQHIDIFICGKDGYFQSVMSNGYSKSSNIEGPLPTRSKGRNSVVEIGINQLGGKSYLLNEKEMKLGERETIEDEEARFYGNTLVYQCGLARHGFSHVIFDLIDHQTGKGQTTFFSKKGSRSNCCL